jgi:hypothetical protein
MWSKWALCFLEEAIRTTTGVEGEEEMVEGGEDRQEVVVALMADLKTSLVSPLCIWLPGLYFGLGQTSPSLPKLQNGYGFLQGALVLLSAVAEEWLFWGV